MSEIDEAPPPAKSPDDASRRAIAEWLRDADEVDELLAQLGGEVSDDPKENRKRLLSIVKLEPPEVVASHMYRLASGFAAMLDDIVEACADWGVSIGGEMLLAGRQPLGRSSSLDTSWTRNAKGDVVLTGTGSLSNTAEQLRGASNRLAGTSLVRKISREELSSLGQDVASHPDPRVSMLVNARAPGMHVRREESAASSRDLQALRACASLTAELQSSSAKLKSAPLSDALNQLANVIRSKLSDLGEIKHTDSPSSPAVQQLTQTLREAASRLPAMASQKVRAKRALRGMGTFVRSECWPSRWRIYEVWVFIRCLRALERAGLHLEFLGMQGDVWQLHYGQNAEPVARASTADESLRLDIYYQLFDTGTPKSKSTEESLPGSPKRSPTNAMPDLAAKRTDGSYLFVVDPKHGPSHRLSKVQDVLNRYAARFKADLTAVVNYTDVPQYQFTKTYRSNTQVGDEILASGIAPGSLAARRLELNIEEAILSQFSSKVRIKGGAKTASRSAPRRSSTLVYWATAPNEIDEPSGAWALESAGELRHLPRLSDAIKDHKAVRSFTTNLQGTKVLLTTEDEVRLASGEGIQEVQVGNLYGAIKASWCRCGEHVLAMSTRHFRVLNSAGEKIADLPQVPGDLAIAWSDDCKVIYTINSSWSVGMARIEDPEAGWKQFSQRGSSYGQPRAVFDSARSQYFVEGHGSGLDAHATIAHLVQGLKPELRAVEPPVDPLWAASPTGDRRVVRGPKSLNYPTSMLKVVDGATGVQIGPHILAPSAPETDVLWSLSGDRFAFMVKWQVYLCAPGERYGMPVAMHRHKPCGFGWFDASLMKRWG